MPTPASLPLLPPPSRTPSFQQRGPIAAHGSAHLLMPKRKQVAEVSKSTKKQRHPSSGGAAGHSHHHHNVSQGSPSASSSASSQPPAVAAFMQRMDSFSTSALVRDASGSVRMVSKDKGLNVVAQLTGMGINEQLAQEAMLKGCNTVEEAMEWIDEEEQRRKHVAPVAASLTSSAASPQAVGPLIIDDFMSEWLHPNWSHVSCVAKLRLSVEQRKSRGQEAIQLALAQPIVAPEGHQLFLLFVDGGPQPPRPTTTWKLAAPDQTITDAVEICAHIDSMMRQGVQQRVVSTGGSMMSIDLRMFTVTNLSRGVAFRLIPEKRLQDIPPLPYKEWSVTENSMLFNVLDAHGNDFHFAPCAPPDIQHISFTPLQDILPFSDLLVCSGVPLQLEDMLSEVREHARSNARSVPIQDLDDCFIGKDVVPLTDCMTGARMSLPGRTIYCRHASAFDLPGFLDAAMKTGLWRCPICLPCCLEVPQRPLLLRELHVDALMQDILASCATLHTVPFVIQLLIRLPGKATSADHCSIEVVRAAGGSRDICLSSNNDCGGAGLCSVSVQAFEKRSPQNILLSLKLHANIAHANIDS